MSRVDFELIAKALREADFTLDGDRLIAAHAIAKVCAKRNTNFNRQQFLDAATRTQDEG